MFKFLSRSTHFCQINFQIRKVFFGDNRPVNVKEVDHNIFQTSFFIIQVIIAFLAAWIRLREKWKDISSLSAQLLRLQRTKLLVERKAIRQELVDLEDNETLEKEIERVEKKFFQKQIEIYDLDLKIVEEEEKLIRLKLKEFLTDGESENEDDFFYEAFEEQPEDLEEQEIKLKEEGKEKSEEWKKKQQFVAKLNRLFRKRAWLRLRKV